MGKIAVFDSGFGSLSIILAIQKTTKADIVYFADQKNYPYGKKTKPQLKKIILHTIKLLRKHFEPDIIIVGSNTPTLLFPELSLDNGIVGVLPPLQQASKQTKTKSIAILATTSSINSVELDNHITNNVNPKISVTKIDATLLIDLVESGKFITEQKYCKQLIKQTLEKIFVEKNIDVVTLSSTHLPFLLLYLEKLFPKIQFLDPADVIAKQIIQNKLFTPSNNNSLEIFTTSDPIIFQKNLAKIKIKNKVTKFQ